MALKLTCPTCAAIFGLPADQRGKKAFCPKCGRSLVVTGAGIAKRGEGVAAVASSPRGFPWLLLALALVLTTAASVVGYFALRHREPPHEAIAAKQADPDPPPEPKKEPEPDRGHETKLPRTEPDQRHEEKKKQEPAHETKKPAKQMTDPEPKAGANFILPLDALGKPERLAKVKGVRMEMKTYDAKGLPYPNSPPLAMTWYAPDRWRFDGPPEKPFFSLALNGQNGWMRASTLKKSFTGQDAKQLRDCFGWIGVGQLNSLTSAQNKLTALGPATVKGRPTTCVQMATETSTQIKLYFDKSNRLLAKGEYQGPQPKLGFDNAIAPHKHLEFYFSDYKETDGIQQWHKLEWSWDGQPGGYEEVTSVRFLAEVDETLLIGP